MYTNYRYPFQIGASSIVFPLVPGGLLPNLTTLADELKAADYSTHAVGKWHLGFCKESYLPTSRGFDHHYGFWVGAEDYYDHTRANSGKMKRSGKMGYDFRDDMEVDPSAKGEYSSILFGKRAEKIIANHNQSNPLFLYLPFQSVHNPLQAPQEYVDMYRSVQNEDRRVFLGMVTAMDDAVGVVIRSLKQAGMFDNTIIIFFSDNGGAVKYGASNWPLRGQKSTLFEGGTRTPAFIHGPGLSPRVEERMFHVTDWYPTLLDAVNLKPKGHQIDGISEWIGLSDNLKDWKRNEIVYDIRTTPTGGFPVSAIRIGDWKYLWHVTGFDGWEKPPEGTNSSSHVMISNDFSHTNQLFNLAEDPLEKNNLADIEPERAMKMKAKLKKHREKEVDLDFKHKEPAGRPDNFGGIWSTGWC